MSYRLGFDVDGVLAEFDTAYQRLTAVVTGRNLFPGDVPADGPHTWDWPEAFGYSKDEMVRVWGAITASPSFWLQLKPTRGMQQLQEAWPSVHGRHDIYFVTARHGVRAKRQTEQWLAHYLGETPTVLLSPHKEDIVKALSISHYIDDNLDNVGRTAIHNKRAQVYLLDRAYNRQEANWLGNGAFSNARRVTSVAEMLLAVLK